MTYAFNITFTRPDEADAIEYEIGFNVEARDRAAAERKLHWFNDHLTVRSVKLVAVMDEDGTVRDEVSK